MASNRPGGKPPPAHKKRALGITAAAILLTAADTTVAEWQNPMAVSSGRYARDALERYAREEVRDPCRSVYLAGTLEHTGDMIRGAGGSFTTLSEAAALLIDIADTAAAKGCAEVARGTYRVVIQTFTGSGYAAYRQLAEIGLADLRARGTND